MNKLHRQVLLGSVIDLHEVVSRYTKMEFKDHNFAKFICPFHEEETSSFVVNIKDCKYHCFSCGESGDIIDFLLKVEPADAVKYFENIGIKRKWESFIEKAKPTGLLMGFCSHVTCLEWNDDVIKLVLPVEHAPLASQMIVDRLSEHVYQYLKRIQPNRKFEGVMVSVYHPHVEYAIYYGQSAELKKQRESLWVCEEDLPL